MIVGERPDDDHPGGDERGDEQPRERRAPDRSHDQRQAGGRQGEGREPPHVERPQQQDDRGQREDGVGDAVLVTGGAQQSCPHGRRIRESDERSPPACRARSRCATSRCARSPPDADICRSRATTRSARRASSASAGSTAARRAASSSDGAMAISSDRSGAVTNTRTWRRPASSVVENIPKPPPFHGLRPAVLASATCRPATSSSAPAARRDSVARPGPSSASVQHDDLISVRHPRVIRGAALRVRRIADVHALCSLPAASR